MSLGRFAQRFWTNSQLKNKDSSLWAWAAVGTKEGCLAVAKKGAGRWGRGY